MMSTTDHLSVHQRKRLTSPKPRESKETESDRVAYREFCDQVGEIHAVSYWPNPASNLSGLESPPILRIVKEIGQGSFGIVYRVFLKQNGRTLALKCVAKKDEDLSTDFTKVKGEFNAWRTVSTHPNVVSLLAFFETERNWCFLSEFISCGSLSGYLKDNDGPMKPSISMPVAAQLAHAIHILHQMGYMHRDISCSNILLEPNTNCEHFNAKLTDFGLSIRGKSSKSRCGSLAYMSPEVLTKSTYGTASDWWSYGIVLYAMFAGKTPLNIFAKQQDIDLGALDKEQRYDLAKTVTIHIGREFTPSQRSLLIELLKDDPGQRLGARDNSNFDLIRRHSHFRGFNWTPLDELCFKESPSEEDVISSRLVIPSAHSPKLRLPHDRSLTE